MNTLEGYSKFLLAEFPLFILLKSKYLVLNVRYVANLMSILKLKTKKLVLVYVVDPPFMYATTQIR